MEDYLKVLNPEQREAVEHEGSPLLILAGAGSGKTRVITTKIAYLIAEKKVDPRQILAVTFTKKAANEMLERAINLEPMANYSQIRTFHSFGAWFLRLYAQVAGISSNFTVYDDDDMVTLVAKSNPNLTRNQASHYAHLISLCKDFCILPDDEVKLKEFEADSDFPQIYKNYTNRLRETGNVDFGDLILLPMLVLEQNEEVRTRLQNRFRVIMVDEYQDSNVAQFRLLQTLAGTGTYVCVVGDDDQSIYKFRGAEIQNILQFQNHFPNTKIIRLESNYRSYSQILNVAGDIVKNNSGRLGKTLRAERGEGKKPVLAFLPNQDDEASFCAELILETHKMGIPYSDWAILYRTNAQSMGFESEFLRQKIPYTIVGSLKFYEREEIKDMLCYLALLANPKDELAFRRIVNKPARGIGATSQEKIVQEFRNSLYDESSGGKTAIDYLETCKKLLPTFSKKAKSGLSAFIDSMEIFKEKLKANDLGNEANEKIEEKLSELALLENPLENEAESTLKNINKVENLSVLVDLIAEKSGLKEYHASQDEISGTQRVLNIQELSNSAVLYKCTTQGLLDFLEHIELDRTTESEQEEKTEQVTLITIHNTKGLEFNRVVMTGMEFGVFPRQDKYGDELEEERRLCYVGITRAREELYFTACAVRRMYGRVEYMLPSPFLQEIQADRIKIIGHIPFGFKKKEDSSNFSHKGDYGELGLSHPDTESDSVKHKYSRGTKVYHDDYGYGTITSTQTTQDGEFKVFVTFENGGSKTFLPKYQPSALLIIKD
ncbi:ATP-dependent helicase [Treponema pectinovorum]|uniref:ATP-dependent helicase n=1 Tax=Treponema pectinovorum TaxID=164 RepID=UPI0011F32BFB|nr:UvrD-helicase domain-containing protein [Treponema pectinovorum]